MAQIKVANYDMKIFSQHREKRSYKYFLIKLDGSRREQIISLDIAVDEERKNYFAETRDAPSASDSSVCGYQPCHVRRLLPLPPRLHFPLLQHPHHIIQLDATSQVGKCPQSFVRGCLPVICHLLDRKWK